MKTQDGIYQAATAYLSQIDSDWALLITEIGPCALQVNPEREPYEALIRTIAHQQLHGRAANAITNKFLQLYPSQSFPLPEQIIATTDETLRGSGFSARKIITIKAVAQATLTGLVPSLSLAHQLSDEELIKRLTSLPGIGLWTVEIFLIYTLERMDILPAADLCLRYGYQKLKDLDRLPSSKELREYARPWSPYRSIASWYLWRIHHLKTKN